MSNVLHIDLYREPITNIMEHSTNHSSPQFQANDVFLNLVNIQYLQISSLVVIGNNSTISCLNQKKMHFKCIMIQSPYNSMVVFSIALKYKCKDLPYEPKRGNTQSFCWRHLIFY